MKILGVTEDMQSVLWILNLKFDQLEDSYLETLDKSLRGLRIASVKENIERIEKSLEREKKLLAELIGE